MSEALLTVEGLSKRFGGFTALNGVQLSVPQGVRLGIIGPNGSGKTTLINCICGALRADTGVLRFAGRDITNLPAYRRTRLGLARSFQLPRPFHSMTPARNVAVALEYAGRAAGAHGNSAAADSEAHSIAILQRVGLAAKRDFAVGALTQVDLRRLELARALATYPRLLILDEVMAGLSPAEVDELLASVLALNDSGVTIIMIEHIMRAIMRFSQRVVCLDAGSVIADAPPQRIIEDPTVRKVYLGA